MASRKIDNPYGPALITPDDMGYFYKNGKSVEVGPLPMTDWATLCRRAMLPGQARSVDEGYFTPWMEKNRYIARKASREVDELLNNSDIGLKSAI